MNRKLKKAVFPVGGFGPRILPATKAMLKDLPPIFDKPSIQYAVGITGLIEKLDVNGSTSNLASIGRYVLKPDIFGNLRELSLGSGGETQLANAIKIHAQQGYVETVGLCER